MDTDHPHAAKPCALCGVNRKLEQSHIIPQFVYRRTKAGSGKNEGQTGTTRRMLCGHCEDRFSFYESEFARHVFHPLVAHSKLTARYNAWLRQFAASVCWRILEDYLRINLSGHAVGRRAPELESCRETWRSYLLGKRPDVAGHHLHLLPLQAVEGEAGAGTSHSQYTIESHVFCDEPEAFVFAKLGPVILLGLIADHAPKQWRGTRINAEGKLKPRDLFVPAPYLDIIISGARFC